MLRDVSKNRGQTPVFGNISKNRGLTPVVGNIFCNTLPNGMTIVGSTPERHYFVAGRLLLVCAILCAPKWSMRIWFCNRSAFTGRSPCPNLLSAPA
ncbi:hypothetical protein GJV26_11030 [Massilia dura]|uniref:Uncharacterized protein n=1 Tax=Pseudoduganella dura TaxID=321982 RepID=A0A6I3XK40_9BURK|nr:hypothetical protein [Pseudoduganella dura]